MKRTRERYPTPLFSTEPAAPEPKSQIFVGKTTAVEIEMTATVGDLKAKIEEKTGVNTDSYLVFEGKVLNDDARTLGDYGIRKESTLDFRLRWRGGGRFLADELPAGELGLGRLGGFGGRVVVV